jgi:hypothetical protein
MALTVIKSSGTNFVGNVATNVATLYSGYIPPIVVNDISSQFDGTKANFTLQVDMTTISTVVDSKDVQVSLNGFLLAPYVTTYSWPWIVEYDSFKGFRVSGSNLIIYNAPGIGDQATVIIASTSASKQYRRYPFSATTIALGD